MATPEAVDRGVATFEKLEDLADEAVEEAKKFDEVFDTICKDGHISKFEAKALKAEARDIATRNRAAWLIFHAKTTQRAQFKGIDIPELESGGGPR